MDVPGPGAYFFRLPVVHRLVSREVLLKRSVGGKFVGEPAGGVVNQILHRPPQSVGSHVGNHHGPDLALHESEHLVMGHFECNGAGSGD